MPYDYTDAPPPRELELIPHGTIATITLHIRPGGVGEDAMLTRTKSGDAEMLILVFVVADGPYKGRKFWEYFILEGVSDGHAKSAEISRGVIKGILDSAFGLKPDDKSGQARAKRTKRLGELEGLFFIAKIGVERGKPKADRSKDSWPDKNILAAVITPDRKEWRPVDQPTLLLDGAHTSQATSQAASESPATPAIP